MSRPSGSCSKLAARRRALVGLNQGEAHHALKRRHQLYMNSASKSENMRITMMMDATSTWN